MNIHQYHQRNENQPPIQEDRQHAVLPLQQEQPHIIPVFDDDDNHIVARRVVVSRHCHRYHHGNNHKNLTITANPRKDVSNHINNNTNNTMARAFVKHNNIMNHNDDDSFSNDQKPQKQHPLRKQYSRFYERSLHRDTSKSRNLPHKRYMKDCIELFDECYSASCQVGASVVKREVIIVNQKLMSFRRRQEQQQQQQHEELKRLVDIEKKNKKHEKRSLDEVEVDTDQVKEEDEESDTLTVHNTNYKNDNDNDIHTSDDGDCYQNRNMNSYMKKRRVSLMSKETDLDQKSNDVSDIPNEYKENEDEDGSCNVAGGVSSTSSVTNDMMISQEERRSIWIRADRMKRLSCLFRQMECIQRTIMNEMKESYNDDYMNDEAESDDDGGDNDTTSMLASNSSHENNNDDDKNDMNV